jgi:subtilisin family serine protease
MTHIVAGVVALAFASSAHAQDGGWIARHAPDGWFARRPLLDRATIDAGIVRARASTGATGRGATICVVDSGLDLRHRDFLDAAGRTRVSWYLDLTSAPRGVHDEREREGGAVWSGGEIELAIERGDPIPRDRHGHGTAVASAAAGDDSDSAEIGVFAGAAPEASLVIVNALRDPAIGFVDEDVLIGARFCAAAGEPGRTVLVLGLGGHDGAHDGSEPIELELTRLIGEGLVIVAAAGNDGARDIHAAGRLFEGERASIPLDVPAIEASDEPRHLVVTLAHDRFPRSVALIAPDGTRLEADRSERRAIEHAGGRLATYAMRDGALFLALEDGAAPLAGGRYEIAIEGPGRFDLYVVDASLGRVFTGPRFGGPFATRAELVTIPATAPGVIAVGASLPRASIETDRTTFELVPNDDGSAPFTAAGPSWSGAAKPEVSAPGLLAVARSGDLDPDDANNLFLGSRADLEASEIGGRLALAGTSFAAPLVAGSIALAMETRAMTPDDARRMLAASAHGERWSPRLGYGTLDAERFLDALGSEPALPSAPNALALTRAFATPGDSIVAALTLRDASGRPARADVRFELNGGSAVTVSGAHGIAEARLEVPPAIAGERIVVRAYSGTTQLGEATAIVASDDARARTGLTVGGGCSAGGETPFGIALLLVMLTSRRAASSRCRTTGPRRPSSAPSRGAVARAQRRPRRSSGPG